MNGLGNGRVSRDTTAIGSPFIPDHHNSGGDPAEDSHPSVILYHRTRRHRVLRESESRHVSDINGLCTECVRRGTTASGDWVNPVRQNFGSVRTVVENRRDPPPRSFILHHSTRGHRAWRGFNSRSVSTIHEPRIVSYVVM